MSNRTHLTLSIVCACSLGLVLAACGDTTTNGNNNNNDGIVGNDVVGGDTTQQTDGGGLPAGATCSEAGECDTGLTCVGAGDGATYVCGTPNTGGLSTGSSCTSHSECELNACVGDICQAPKGTGVIVGSGDQCNWIDSPEACLGWNCLYEAGQTTCRHPDQAVPNSNVDWTCEDVDGSTVCRAPGDVPNPDPSWTCSASADGTETVCTRPADTPDNDDVPGGSPDAEYDWNCEFVEGSGGTAKVCTTEGGGPGTGCPSGNVEGFACTPNGVDVSGATVTIEYTDCAGNPTSQTVESDALGYYSFGGIPEGNWTLTIEKGPYSTTTDVGVLANQTTSLIDGNEREACFDPDATKIAVVGGKYDEIGAVLTTLGFEFDYYDGVDQWEGWNFLLDPAAMDTYDIIFINCGVHPESDFGAHTAELTTIGQNIANYVEAGHYVYASDWAYYFVESAYPNQIDFRGDDMTNVDVLIGAPGVHAVAVTDEELRAYTGLSTAMINLDLDLWAIAIGVADGVKTYLKGDARLVDSSVLSNVPFLVDFNAGDGSVVYTSYHIHSNQEVDDFFAFLALNFK